MPTPDDYDTNTLIKDLVGALMIFVPYWILFILMLTQF